MNWGDVLLWELPRWLLWGIFAPFLSQLARRYPVTKQNAVRQITLHTLFGAAISFVHLILFVLIEHWIRQPGPPDNSLTDLFLFAFPLDFHVGIAVYWLIVLLRQRSDSEQHLSRLQAELSRAQLDALKMQLHPHFLFNTLNSISSYLRTDIEVADEMIGQLGDFLRLTLRNPGAEEIELEKELDLMKRYLGIEQLRFQDRLQTLFDIEPESHNALVPNLILQPVVENAVRHGISAVSGSGFIRIAARRRANTLQICIVDNGPGLPQRVEEGIGIATTRQRLIRMYGAEGKLELKNEPAGGTLVVLEFPFRVSREVA